MARFHHHPDGLVIVESDAGFYLDSPANFAADLGEPYDGLPPGAAERLYEPGARHVVADAKGNAEPQIETAYPFGDAAIAALPSLLAAQAKRQAAIPAKAPPAANTVGASTF